MPVYGDDIIGYISKGNGINVHRSNCHNLSMLENRNVEVKWNDNTKNRYLSILLIYSNTLDNHIVDLIQAISMLNVNVDGINTINKTEQLTYEAHLYVNSLEQLDKVIIALDKLKYVTNVERLIR